MPHIRNYAAAPLCSLWQMASYEVLDSKSSVRAIIRNHYQLSFPLCEQLFKVLLDRNC